MSARRTTLVLFIPGRAAVTLELQALARRAILAVVVLPMLLCAAARYGYETLTAPMPLVLAVANEAGHNLRRARAFLRPLVKAEPIGSFERASTRPRQGWATAQRAAGATVNARAVLRSFRSRHALLPLGVEPGDGVVHLRASHLGESLRIRPFSPTGAPDPQAFSALAHLMRCRVTGEEVSIDPALVRILVALGDFYDKPILLISGHRSVDVNGTSPTSQHTLGRAADIRIGGVSIEALRRTALELGARGLGLYPEKGFLHVDVRKKLRYSWIYTEADGEQTYVSPELVNRTAALR